MKIVIFSGTTEGRKLSEMLSCDGFFHHVCVASEYGEKVMKTTEYANVHTGRMDTAEMLAYFEKIGLAKEATVVDATHPYAKDVSLNIKEAVKDTGCRLIRINRSGSNESSYVNQYDSMKDFARTIDESEGNILITTGSKELRDYCENVSQDTLERTFVRVIPSTDSIDACMNLGIENSHIIAMQGPFSYELNKALITQYNIRHLLTKESGTAGGYEEKITAARDTGISCHVITRPDYEDEGERCSVYEAYTAITGKKYIQGRCVILAGTGPGDERSMTGEVKDALKRCDAVFGAASVIKNISASKKYDMYVAKDIIKVLDDDPSIKTAVVLFSGDTGFYSGAKEAYGSFKEWEGCATVTVLPGISSVSYLAAKVGKSYDGALITSIHGCDSEDKINELVENIGRGHMTYVLTSSAGNVSDIAKKLFIRGIDATLYIGCDLSYGTETVDIMTAEEACGYDKDGKITVLFIKNKPSAFEGGGIPRVMLAAPQSGAGKTILTMGLLKALIDRGENPASYKCGPDYIDPMYHRNILGIEGGNLDSYFETPDGIRNLVASCSGSVAVMEGVMGIYDGVKPASLSGSCYDIARITGTPVILIMNARGTGSTVISLIKGIIADDSEHLIRGIILNRMSQSFYDKLLPQLTGELERFGRDIKVIGHIPDDAALKLEGRHLGLVTPNFVNDMDQKSKTAARLLEQYCDIGSIKDIAKTAGNIPKSNAYVKRSNATANNMLRLAVSSDEAFCFCYRENLKLFEDMGIMIEPFSTIHDKCIPPNVSGILLTGGYPELYLESLSANKEMLCSIRDAIRSGMPSLAECGGFMYLHDEVEDTQGNPYKTVGIIDGRCRYTGHLVNFGYVEVKGYDKSGSCDFLPGIEGMRGHEFHYFESSCNAADVVLKKASSQKEYADMLAGSGSLWGFAHFYYPSAPGFIEAFVEKMKQYGS